MPVVKAVMAFVIGLAVSLATQGSTSRSSWALIAKDGNAMNKVRMSFLVGQLLTVAVLFVFKGNMLTLLAAGLGLLLPKNVLMFKHFLVRWGLSGRRSTGR